MWYQKITPDKAREAMRADPAIIPLDVRTREEYEEKRIPGAVLLPVDELEQKAEMVLPDKDVALFVYCRSGMRSRNACMKLMDLGYTRVTDMGGLIDWTYETDWGI